MIDHTAIQAQLNRVSHLQGYPKTREAVDDLIDAFSKLELAKQAKEVIDRWLDMPALDLNQRPMAPTDYDIKRIIRQMSSANEWKSPNYAKSDAITDQGWFIPDLATRPEFIANYQRMRSHSKFSHARVFAAKVLEELSDYMGQEL